MFLLLWFMWGNIYTKLFCVCMCVFVDLVTLSEIYACDYFRTYRLMHTYHSFFLPYCWLVIISLQSIFILYIKNIVAGVPIVVQWKLIWLVSMEIQVQYLALLSGLSILHCYELWCRSQPRLRSGVAVAVAVVQALSCSSDLTLILGTSICCGSGPKKDKSKIK